MTAKEEARKWVDRSKGRTKQERTNTKKATQGYSLEEIKEDIRKASDKLQEPNYRQMWAITAIAKLLYNREAEAQDLTGATVDEEVD